MKQDLMAASIESSRKQSLFNKLMIWFVLVSLIPVILVSLISYDYAKNSLRQATISELEHTSDLTVNYIQGWFDYRFTDLQSHANNPEHRMLLESLIRGFNKSEKTLSEYVRSDGWKVAVADYGSSLRNFSKNYRYVYDVFLIDLDGNILFTIAHESDFGTNLFTGPLVHTSFSKTALKSIKADELLFSDLEKYEPSGGRGDGFITAPIKNEKNEIMGLIAVQIKLEDIYAFLSMSNQLNGAQQYLVGSDGYLRSLLEPTQTDFLNTKIETYQVEKFKAALITDSNDFKVPEKAQERTVDGYVSQKGLEVLGFHRHVNILNINWALISEVDKNIALASESLLKKLMFFLVLVSVLLSAGVSFYLARRITRPIERLSEATMLIAAGEQNQYVDFHKNDEVGRLARAFNYMLMMRSVHEKALEQSNAETQFALTKMANQQEELVKAKNEAELAVKAKSQFLASMSHEIRTPMNGVLGMLSLLLQSKLNKQQKHQVSLARSSADSLLAVINDILDFSKIEAGKLEVEIIDFDLREMIGDFSEAIGHRSTDNNVELIFDLTGIKQKFVRGDSGRIRQIFSNLVSNALKFTHQGEVLVKAWTQDTLSNELNFHCTVSDTGIGIHEEKLQQLFAAFVQVDASTTRQYGGSGLGLAIVKQLCNLMGGDISVYSKQGEGSRFTFTLKLERSEKDHGISVSHDVVGLNILLVEDNVIQSEVIQKQLEVWGVDVTLAHSGEEALALINQKDSVSSSPVFNGLIIDMFLGDMNGQALVKRIREKAIHDSLSLVMMSSFKGCADQRKMRQLGVCDCFPKPVTTRDLLNALNSICQDTSFDRVLMSEQSEISEAVVADVEEVHVIQPSWAPNTRVLIVEDNQVNQTVALSLLELLGLTADVASNGIEAIDALKQAPESMPYNIVLMDCQMPLMDGYEASRKIRAGEAGSHYQSISIVAMTANAMKGDREKCLDAGMDDYISKPINTDLLEEKLKRYLIQGKRSDSELTEAQKGKTELVEKSQINKKTEPSMADNNSAPQEKVMTANDSLMIWDMADAFKRVMGKEKILKVLVAAFLADMPNYVQTLDENLNDKDISAASQTAHAIKGVAGNLSTLALADYAKSIERACLDKAPFDEILTLNAQLQLCFPLTCEALKKWQNDPR